MEFHNCKACNGQTLLKKIKLPIHTDLKTFNDSLGGGGQYRLGSGGIGVRVV